MVLALSAVASLAYAVIGAIWYYTTGPRQVLLQGSRAVAAIVLRVALQLFISLLLSIALYSALYTALVPGPGAQHALHFGLCQSAAVSNGQSPPAARVARIMFSRDADTLFSRQPLSMAAALQVDGISTVPPLARAYDYTVGVCLRLCVS